MARYACDIEICEFKKDVLLKYTQPGEIIITEEEIKVYYYDDGSPHSYLMYTGNAYGMGHWKLKSAIPSYREELTLHSFPDEPQVLEGSWQSWEYNLIETGYWKIQLEDKQPLS